MVREQLHNGSGQYVTTWYNAPPLSFLVEMVLFLWTCILIEEMMFREDVCFVTSSLVLRVEVTWPLQVFYIHEKVFVLLSHIS